MTELEVAASLVDLVIAITVIEALALSLLHWRTGRGVAPRDFLINLSSGLCLMLALRSVLRDAGITWLALWLLAAGAAHAIDIAVRWRRHKRPDIVKQGITA